MKILIAVVACHKRAHYTQFQRETWIQDVIGADCRFFYGRGSHSEPKSDEVVLDVPDDYEHLSEKVQAIFQYALANGYSFVFKVDDDAYVCPERLLKSGFEKHHYTGPSLMLGITTFPEPVRSTLGDILFSYIPWSYMRRPCGYAAGGPGH